MDRRQFIRMSLFSKQSYFCCICQKPVERACGDGPWKTGTCSMRCYYEKDWRETLSIMGKPYKPDPREYDAHGYPIRKDT